MEAWSRPKTPSHPAVAGHAVERGCPFDCGLCPAHRQHTCTLILEVTPRCNLACPVCYADARPAGPDPSVEAIARWFRQARRTAGAANIQLSGGEPTVRDDLPDIIALGRKAGFGFMQINTNGLRLATEQPYLEALKAAGLASVFLQFDGTREAVYRRLRGRALLDAKLAAIRACRAAGVGVVLVPTLVPGVNTQEIGPILNLALEHFPTVRGVHFQPVSYFGRYPGPPTDRGRWTLPELMRAIEHQTQGRMCARDFRPPGCENAWCSCHAQYLVSAEGQPRPLQPPFRPTPEAPPLSAEVGAARAIAFVVRQWSPPPAGSEARPSPAALPGCACAGGRSEDLDAFLARARSQTFAVSAMAFQDAWNLDLERVRDCCIHVLAPDGTLVPFCLYNLTAVDGRRLYRP
jgi:uncharacterized radical SAM superfamily Fe-S cluster-containing enzyme